MDNYVVEASRERGQLLGMEESFFGKVLVLSFLFQFRSEVERSIDQFCVFG